MVLSLRVTLSAVLVAAWALALACGGPEAPPAAPSPATRPDVEPIAAGVLDPGDPVERPIAAGETHAYRLELPAACFLEIEADAYHLDLEVTLFDPEGKRIADLESPASRRGPERIVRRSETAGTYRLEVHGDSSGSADGQTSRGRYRLVLYEPRPAIPLDELRVEAQRLHNQGLALAENEHSGTDRRALEAFQQALDLRRQADDPKGRTWTILWTGRMLRDLSRFPGAEAHYLEALEGWRQLNDEIGEAETLYRLGTMYRAWGRFEDSLRALAGALPLWQQVEDLDREAATTYNQGLVYRQLAAMQQALDHYHRARALYARLGNRSRLARTVNNIAVTHQMLGASEQAIEGFREALEIHEELGDLKSQASTLNNIGWVVHHARHEPGKAMEQFQRALRLAETTEDLNGQITYLNNLGRARLDLGDPAGALRDAKRAHQLSVRARDPGGQASSLILTGAALLASGEVATAELRFAEALNLSRSLGSRGREAEALFQLARTRRAAGRFEQAQADAEGALAILESVRTDVDSRSLKSTFLAFRRPYYELEIELWVELARRHPGSGHESRALAASERARARSLLETLVEAGADLNLGVDAAILNDEQELRRRINEEETRRWRADESERDAIGKRLSGLLSELETVQGRIRDQSPQYAAIARPEALGLDAVQRQVLDPDSLLLEYSLGDERSFLFAVSKHAIEIFDLPPRAAIEVAAREVYDLLTDRFEWLGPAWRLHQARYDRAAAALTEMILAPVAGKLDGRRLLIAAEGPLHSIPFAALPSPLEVETGRGEPLVVRHEVVNLPSASALAVLRRQFAGRPTAPRALAVLADPVFDTRDSRFTVPPQDTGSEPQAAPRRSARELGLREFRRLRHSRREAQTIASMVAPSQRLVALDFAASRASALAPELGRYRFLHFATHGFLDSRTPELSGLVLSLVDEVGRSQDGFLRLHDVYNLELQAELVVLSACQTALGKAIRGEGLIGLVRGFLYAGAEGVVASLWQIEDDSTGAFMASLYRGLMQQGLPPGAALRNAQLEMLRGDIDPAWRAPYHWAAFVLQGEWRHSG